jgi:hypothetical protein
VRGVFQVTFSFLLFLISVEYPIAYIEDASKALIYSIQQDQIEQRPRFKMYNIAYRKFIKLDKKLKTPKVASEVSLELIHGEALLKKHSPI